MNVNEAWDAFIKSQAIKKASIDEKLDVLAAQMNEVQTTVDRLAETIPEEQGDAAAIDMANDSADITPNPEEALGEIAGAPQEEGVAAPAGAEEPTEGGEEGGGLPEEGEGAEEMPALGGEDPGMGDGPMPDIPPLTEEEMDAPSVGESNDVIAMVKEMIASENDPTKLQQLSKILSAAVGTQNAQSEQSYEEPDFSGEGSEMQMMKSDSVAKAEGEGTGVQGEKSAVDTDGNGTSGKDTVDQKPGAAQAEAAVDDQLQDAPKPMAASAKSEGPTPELMEAIMDAVKGVLMEFFGEDGEEIEDAAEEAAEGEGEPKIDDEDADVHIDAEEGSTVEVESDDDKKGEDEDDISDEEKIDRNEEFSDDSLPFADCVTKSFADMLKSNIATHVGVDGQFAKGTIAKYYDGEDAKSYTSRIEAEGLNDDERNQLDAIRNYNKKGQTETKPVADSACAKEGEGFPVVGSTGATPQNSTEGMDSKAVADSAETEVMAESDCADTGAKKVRTPAQKKFRSMNPELYDHVDSVETTKSAMNENGKPIMSLKDMMAIQKSDRMEVAATSNGSLSPPTLEGASPIKMSSFRDMMAGGNNIRKSIEDDTNAYRLYKSQQSI